MINILTSIFIGSIITEALTELLVKSDFFFFLRDFFDKRSSKKRVYEFFSDLLFCGYCTSVWVAFFITITIVLFLDTNLISKWLDWFFIWIIIHRVSNILHFLVDFLDKARGCCEG